MAGTVRRFFLPFVPSGLFPAVRNRAKCGKCNSSKHKSRAEISSTGVKNGLGIILSSGVNKIHFPKSYLLGGLPTSVLQFMHMFADDICDGSGFVDAVDLLHHHNLRFHSGVPFLGYSDLREYRCPPDSYLFRVVRENCVLCDSILWQDVFSLFAMCTCEVSSHKEKVKTFPMADATS